MPRVSTYACMPTNRLPWRMTAEASHEWLEAALWKFLQQDIDRVSRMNIIAAADAGDQVADAALGRLYHDLMEGRQTPPPSMISYEARARKRGGLTRKAGRYTKYDNWRRDVGVACLIYLVAYRFRLSPTRGRESRRERPPSGASIVRLVLRKRSTKISESRLNNIWGILSGDIIAFVIKELDLPGPYPSITP